MNTGGPSSNDQRLDARQGVTRGLVYAAATVAPHGATTRATYTVPAATRAILESCHVSFCVDVLQTAIGLSDARVTVTPDSGGLHTALGCLAGVAITVGSRQSDAGATAVILNTGNVVTIVTEDAATGGSKRFDATAEIYEFNP